MTDCMNLPPARRIVALLAIILTAWVTPAPAQTVIKLGTIAPEGSIWHDALLKVRQAWKEKSGGKVELRIFAGGVLGAEEELVRKMQRQTIDAVTLSGAGLHQVDAAFNCFSLPAMFDQPGKLDHVRERIAPAIEQRLAGRGIVTLNWAVGGMAYLFSKTPLRTPDDLRRRKLWMPPGAPYMERIYLEIGMRPIALPATEMLTGLQTGLIDVIAVPPLFALLDRSYQSAGYMTDLEWGSLIAATLVNARSWQRVPAELRAPLIQVSREIGLSLRDEARRAERDAIAQMQARGLQVVTLTAAERAQWRKESRDTYPRLRGEYCPPELYDEVMRLNDAFSGAGK
jgi:TRAP-type C4-dicarboxylate transport system substrate-binding protein